jgi:EAL domain-containing protein (putative c-di-GMP-specific phosphodiesterase class I)
LKDYTIDVFKIHLDFFINSGKIDKNKIILKYIISMAKQLNIMVVFEVLENCEQLEFAQKLGVDYFQGNYFSHAICLKDFNEKYLSDIYKPID